MKDINHFYLSQKEPEKRVFLALREIILHHHPDISHKLKYGMPFFCFKNKMFCYLWFHKKLKKPYIGFVNGNLMDDVTLIQEKRSRMKILLIEPTDDLPLERIVGLIDRALDLSFSKGFSGR